MTTTHRSSPIPTCPACGATLLRDAILDDGYVECPRCPQVWDAAEVIP